MIYEQSKCVKSKKYVISMNVYIPWQMLLLYVHVLLNYHVMQQKYIKTVFLLGFISYQVLNFDNIIQNVLKCIKMHLTKVNCIMKVIGQSSESVWDLIQ